jgi:ABC-2 type transport system permease protein
MMNKSTWLRIRALIVKEMLAILYDRKARHFPDYAAAHPAAGVIQRRHLEVKNIEIAVYNQDSGYYSAELIQRINGSPYVKALHIARDEKELHHLIDTQAAIVALQFPSDFSRQA